MAKLHVVARIVARPESVPFVRDMLAGLRAPTREEQGCLVYDLMQNNTDPADFTFYEEWTDGSAIDAHAVSEHIRSTFEKLDGHLAAPPDVRRYSMIR